MDELKITISLIEEIDRLCLDIIQKSLGIMKSLVNDDNVIVLKMKKLYPNLSEKRIADCVREVSLKNIRDAEKIRFEIPQLLNSSEHSVGVDVSKCPYFEQVWRGDIYDRTGTDALRDLKSDLKEQLDTISRKNFVKDCTKALSQI